MILISNWDDNYGPIAMLTEPSKVAWCERSDVEHRVSHHAGHWGKLLAILEHWQDGEWMWWLDSDALIVNPQLRLSPMIGDVIVSCDENGFNAGSMFFYGVPEVRQVIEECIDKQATFIWNNGWHDQNALAFLLWKIHVRVRVVEQFQINSYPWTYRDGDMVVHSPGGTMSEKLTRLQRFAHAYKSWK